MKGAVVVVVVWWWWWCVCVRARAPGTGSAETFFLISHTTAGN